MNRNALSDKRIYTHFLPALACIVMIFGLSSIPRLTGPDLGIPFADKLFHFVEYCGASFFMARCLNAYLPMAGRKRLATLMLIMAIIALGDELYQGVVPGRFTDPFDLVADIAGAVAGGCFFAVLNRPKSIS